MNTQSPLFKYKIGLLVLGLFALGVLIFTLVQASSSKQDAKTHTAAIKIADKLNNYILDKDALPDSLEELDVDEVPSTIQYEKLSEEKYRFCITYKSDSSNLDASTVINEAITGYYGDYSYESDDDTYLYISDSYKKGRHCKTITPYFYNTNNYDFDFDDTTGSDSSSSSQSQGSVITGDGPYFACNQSYNYAWTMLAVDDIVTDPTRTITVRSSPASTFQLSSTLKVFDRDCTEIALSDVGPGDTVGLYFNPYGSPVSMIIKEY